MIAEDNLSVPSRTREMSKPVEPTTDVTVNIEEELTVKLSRDG